MIILLVPLPGEGAGGISKNIEKIKKQYENIDLLDGVSKKEAIIIAQKCLIESEYSEQYYISKYEISYDKGEIPFTNLWNGDGRHAWLIQFKPKNNSDNCMYGVIVFEDGKETHCECMNGL